MKIRLMKILDAVLGAPAVKLFAELAQTPPDSQIESILLIRPGGIGDAVLLAPAISHLRKIYPSIKISVLAERRNAGVFALLPGVGTVYRYDIPNELYEAVRGSYDAVIDTEQWHRLSAVVARLVRAPLKIGFDTNERRRMFTHSVSYSHDDYEVDSFNRLVSSLTSFDLPVDACIPFLSVPEASFSVVEKLLLPLQGKHFIVIFPGASIVERRWGRERFRAVANSLQQHDMQVVAVGSSVDWEEARFITETGGINLAGRTSLAETAAILARSSLLISGDSGVLHIAVGLGVPTVSLFGPGRSLKWAPRGDQHVVLNKQLPCSPCTTFGMTPSCPDDVRCMKDITVDEVVAAALRLLGKESS